MTATKIHKIDEISDKLAEQFIKALSENKLPWQKDCDISCIDPHNPAIGTVYTGTSRYILVCEQNDKGYDDPKWLTFNNGKDLGVNIKRRKITTCIRFHSTKKNSKT